MCYNMQKPTQKAPEITGAIQNIPNKTRTIYSQPVNFFEVFGKSDAYRAVPDVALVVVEVSCADASFIIGFGFGMSVFQSQIRLNF